MKKERPREKLVRLGPEGLKDEELLALILRTGYVGKDVFELSKGLLSKYSVNKLLNMTFKELASIKGVGNSKAATILAAKELVSRITRNSSIPRITNPVEVIAQVNEIRNRQKEHFVVLYLNARNEFLSKEFISIGTLDASIVHPREVFSPAMEHHAASIVLTHNHPSSDPLPSDNDKQITKKLVNSGAILGIEVLDHVIVTKDSYYSFKEQIPSLLVSENDNQPV